ncbi:MAG TPA: ArsR family transcriptional regulator [Thermoprotei archaeon]|nr:ArsR family transcriptional regulator [Thermoprotei archaeon]
MMAESNNSEKLFDAISHPLRIKILEELSRKPMGFAELKRKLGITSSGKLDFHLKKLNGLVTVNSYGKYTLTSRGYAALQAVNVAKRYGWQKRAFYFNIIAILLLNLYFAAVNPWMWLIVALPISSAWIIFYSYWSIVRRKIFLTQ